MSTAHIIFLGVAAIALLVGGTMLLRPALVRKLFGLRPGEAAGYALRIAGAMVASFGLALGGFVLAVTSNGNDSMEVSQ